MTKSGKHGKTTYSPALRLKMKIEAEKPQGKRTSSMAASVKELLNNAHC